MITIITGKPGSGKSYWLSEKAKEILSNPKETREVWANFKIQDPRVRYYEDVLDLINKKDIVVFMDEADENLDARDWKDLPKEVRRKFRQHRHHSIDIYACSQDFGFIDVSIRKLTAKYYEIKKLIGTSEKYGRLSKYPLALFLLREYHPLEYDKVRRKLFSWRLFWSKKEIFNYYDTYEDISNLLTFAEKENVKLLPVFCCPTCGSRRIKKD